jgi:hypothetical protein
MSGDTYTDATAQQTWKTFLGAMLIAGSEESNRTK